MIHNNFLQVYKLLLEQIRKLWKRTWKGAERDELKRIIFRKHGRWLGSFLNGDPGDSVFLKRTGGKEGYEGEKDKPRKSKQDSFTKSYCSEHLWNKSEAADEQKMVGFLVRIWFTSDRIDIFWPLGSHRPNTSTLQTISQCFTSKLHYVSNLSQHAGQAILAYQPLVNLSPFLVKGMMRVLQMQKFHNLNSFQNTAFSKKFLFIYICPKEQW